MVTRRSDVRGEPPSRIASTFDIHEFPKLRTAAWMPNVDAGLVTGG